MVFVEAPRGVGSLKIKDRSHFPAHYQRRRKHRRRKRRQAGQALGLDIPIGTRIAYPHDGSMLHYAANNRAADGKRRCGLALQYD